MDRARHDIATRSQVYGQHGFKYPDAVGKCFARAGKPAREGRLVPLEDGAAGSDDERLASEYGGREAAGP